MRLNLRAPEQQQMTFVINITTVLTYQDGSWDVLRFIKGKSD
jgi:hypothetical protein